MRFVYMDIFLYLCIMNDEQYRLITNSKYGSEWVIDNDDIFGIDDPLSAYYKIESVKRLGEIGIHVTFYNRNKIIHPYGKRI